MKKPNPGAHQAAATPEDEFVLVVAVALCLGPVLGGAGGLWLLGADQLVQWGVLVGAETAPLLVLPGAGGAGLDLPRIQIAAGLTLVLLTAAISTVWRTIQQRSEETR